MGNVDPEVTAAFGCGHQSDLFRCGDHPLLLTAIAHEVRLDRADPVELLVALRHVQRIREGFERIGAVDAGRSEERRVGKECVSTCRSRRSPYHSQKKQRRTTTKKTEINR